MTRVVNCPKCKKKGSLQPKKTKHGTYWRVAHYIGLRGETRRIKWCYIGKELPEEYTSQLITHDYQKITQDNIGKSKEQRSSKITLFQKATALQLLLPNIQCMHSQQALLNIPSKKCL